MPRLSEVLPFGWAPSDDPEVEYLYSVIVGNTDPESPVKRLHVVYSDVMRLERTDDLELALNALERDLQLFVGEMARGRIFVHAGVVGWEGIAIVMPGASFSGKSTLVAALVRAGAIYYSDEFAVLDEAGLVYPFARPLSLRCSDPYRGEPVSVEDLGGTAGVDPLPIGIIVTSVYEEDGVWAPAKLSQGKAILALLANTLSARTHPELILPVLEGITRNTPAFSGVRGEADQIVRFLLSGELGEL